MAGRFLLDIGAEVRLAASWIRAILALACACVAATGALAQAPDAAETRKLHDLFEADWEWSMRTFPEWATYVGDHRYGNRLNDRSLEADESEFAYARERLARLRAIERSRLAPSDRVSLDILTSRTSEWLEWEKHPGARTQRLTALDGLHIGFAELLRVSPMATEQDARNVLARMQAFPASVDQVIARMRKGIALGWVTFRQSMEKVPGQIDQQLLKDSAKSPLYEPFTRLGTGIPDSMRAELAEAGRHALKASVYPAMLKLRAFIVDEYLPHSPADGALSGYRGGAATYDFLVRLRTTTMLDARAIHAIGQAEVTRLRASMEDQMKASGFTGGFDQFIAFLNTDPRFFHPDAEALLARYREISARVDPQLPLLFAELPRASYGIRSIPAHHGTDKMDNYDAPALDGSRPGWFNANTTALSRRPTWGMETLFAHEAVPGHHLQIARAQELADMPKFRRNLGYPAYVEGWALYAETLGDRLGLYADPYSRFGHLQWRAFRAARLVVDTGIHSLGWTRLQAIDWMTERTGFARETIVSEVDRYYVWPAQALGYMIGALRIADLRDRAEAALGARFDIRRFHSAVLDTGAVPLGVLEQRIDEWIAAGGRAGF
jgi:uncharacterized protein (DUF885 family)